MKSIKKLIIMWSFALLAIFFCFRPGPAMAIGPVMVGPHTAAWSYEAGVAGYYVYWSTATPPVWTTANRVQLTQPTGAPTTVTYNLLSSITANGSYSICVTAYDTGGDESGPSNIVPFALSIPSPPTGLGLQ